MFSVQHTILHFILINQNKRNCSSLLSMSMFPINFFHYAIKYMGFRIKTFENNLVFDLSKTKHRYGSIYWYRIKFTKTYLFKKNALCVQ